MSRKNFYRECYLRTGWLPMQPLGAAIAVGDACQVLQGRFQPLLNIADVHLVEPVCGTASLALGRAEWRLAHRVAQVCCETRWEDEGGALRAWTRQELEFAQCGDFIFSGRDASVRLLRNWDLIRKDLTLKLTQLHYGFRELYVVTGVVTMDTWALAVAAQAGARLEMSAAYEGSDWYALLGHAEARVERCLGMAVCELGRGRPAHFFQAKKLVLSDAAYDRYLNQLLELQGRHGPLSLADWDKRSLLNLVKGNDLTLNNCVDFFSWVDMSLDDAECLAG